MFDEMFEIVYEGDEHDAQAEAEEEGEGEGEGEEVMMLAGPPMAFGPPLRSPGHVLSGGRLPMPLPMPLPMSGLGRAVLPSAVLGRGRGGGAGRARRGGEFVAAARRYPDVARLRAAVEAAEVEEREEEAAFVRRVRAWRNASLGSEVWRNAGLTEAREARETREADGMRCELASDDEEQQAEEAGEGRAGAPSSSASTSREQLRGQRPASSGRRGQWAGRLRRQ
eukprot:scaffold2237_cov44-Phaeocystis_antarctica.AAC.1